MGVSFRAFLLVGRWGCLDGPLGHAAWSPDDLVVTVRQPRRLLRSGFETLQVANAGFVYPETLCPNAGRALERRDQTDTPDYKKLGQSSTVLTLAVLTESRWKIPWCLIEQGAWM